MATKKDITNDTRVDETSESTARATAAQDSAGSVHTPGPWREGIEGNWRVYGPDGKGEHSGLVAHAFKSRANARLIAAAPELLAALKRYVDHFGDPLKVARPAIAKAEGREVPR